MSELLKSRKFWITTIDVVSSLLIYFLTKYATPSATDDVIKVIASVQPIIIMWVYAIAQEDVAKLSAGVHPLQLNK